MCEEISWEQTDGTAPDYVRNVSEECGYGGGALLIGGPSWVRSPPELGNEKFYIQRQGWATMSCPICEKGERVYVIALEKDWYVSCCDLCKKYTWFRRRHVSVHEPDMGCTSDGK